jgi:hypothetical protein
MFKCNICGKESDDIIEIRDCCLDMVKIDRLL